jgi:ribosomal protein L35
MKKPRNTEASKKRARKKGEKEIKRKKVAKRHLKIKQENLASFKRKEEKIWQEYYEKLMNS